ncbi:HeH/LEM domain-containing protein [Streptococcus uberis]|uniref:HeH/LEM domain-containing protein n=1 Tax=Streptococcus uberis TaxID=1349 RepID=UPI001939C4BC|nr:HeH/LEM domain-containing protein [Streptococcus uberis]
MKELYLVIEPFTDGLDENVEYPLNAIYPREGHTPSEERIYQLSTFNNAIGRPLIQKLIQLPKKAEDEKVEEPIVDDIEEVEEQAVDEIDQEKPLEKLTIDELKAILDERGQSYAKTAKKEILVELVKAGE